MVSKIARLTLTALALIGFAGAAQALQYAELTVTDCDAWGCDGSTLFLSAQEQADGSWVVTYTIDTTNYTGDRIGFNQIGFKVIDNWTLGDPDNYMISSPAGSIDNDMDPTNDPWDPIFDDPIASNSLCDTSNGDTEKVCIQGFVNITAGGEYTWVFHIADGTLRDVEDWHLGAQYANGYWRSQGKIISFDAGVPIPEPMAAMLFGLGAIVVTRTVRSRR
jgi:hypothetical protein